MSLIRMEYLAHIPRVMRMKQWIKNGFVFLPLLFSGQCLDRGYWLASTMAFLGFSLVSSAVYIANDVLDRERDRSHPRKCLRPIAAGQVSLNFAALLGLGCMILGIRALSGVGPGLWVWSACYVVLQLFYNFFAKDRAIFDVVTLALGFQIRIWVGSVAIMVVPSLWMQLCVFMLSLFLGFAKRRSEQIVLKDNAVRHRAVLGDYPPALLDRLIFLFAALSILSYAFYAGTSLVHSQLSPGIFLYSIGFVVAGIARYLYLIYVKACGEDLAEILLKDVWLFLTVLWWLYYMAFLIYIIK
ncbi:MAG: UbiA prenyltransferase family protein [Candidatus Omnitrophica bacterium]|nr:UbiA prenyltransferase family protein [Candidatus Omnitrophota bacterium]